MGKYKIIAHVGRFIPMEIHRRPVDSYGDYDISSFLTGHSTGCPGMSFNDFGKRKKRAIYLDQQDSGTEIALSIHLMSILDIYFFRKNIPWRV